MSGRGREPGGVGDAGAIRAALERAVRAICPPWLAAQADDVVQEAWLRVEKARAEESGPPNASYLWKTAHSAAMDAIRRRRRLREEAHAEEPDRMPSAEPSPERAGQAAEIRRAVEEELARLAPDRRAAVLLFLYGYSLKESATMLGWTPKRADNQRYQGLAELRRRLAERGIEP